MNKPNAAEIARTAPLPKGIRSIACAQQCLKHGDTKATMRHIEDALADMQMVSISALDAAAVQPSQSAVECAGDILQSLGLSRGHMESVRIARRIQAFADAQQIELRAELDAVNLKSGEYLDRLNAHQPAVQPVQSDREAFSKAFDLGYEKGVEVIARHREQAVAAANQQVEELSALVRQLVHYKDESGSIRQSADDYMQRKGLRGSVLRVAAQPADAVREALQTAIDGLRFYSGTIPRTVVPWGTIETPRAIEMKQLADGLTLTLASQPEGDAQNVAEHHDQGCPPCGSDAGTPHHPDCPVLAKPKGGA